MTKLVAFGFGLVCVFVALNSVSMVFVGGGIILAVASFAVVLG